MGNMTIREDVVRELEGLSDVALEDILQYVRRKKAEGQPGPRRSLALGALKGKVPYEPFNRHELWGDE